MEVFVVCVRFGSSLVPLQAAGTQAEALGWMATAANADDVVEAARRASGATGEPGGVEVLRMTDGGPRPARLSEVEQGKAGRFARRLKGGE